MPVTVPQLWMEITQHPTLVSRLPKGDANARRRCMRYCQDIASANRPSVDDPVTPESLVLFDLLLARLMRKRLVALKREAETRGSTKTALSLQKLIDKNDEFSESAEEDLKEAEQAARNKNEMASLLVDRLGIPKEIALRCVRDDWTLGELMLAYPPFFVRNCTFA